MSRQSLTSPDLFLLDNHTDFQIFSLKLLVQAQRNLGILSYDLDSAIFGSNEFVSAVSKFARANRFAQIRILIKDVKLLIDAGHPLIKLAQRLPSKMHVRKLVVEPDDKNMGFVLFDSNGLLYKNDETVYQGFANFNAGVEVNRLRTVFDYIWEYGEIDPDLQQLYI